MLKTILEQGQRQFQAPAQEYETEAEVFRICARAGVSCISIQRGFGVVPDYVLFQPTVTT